MIRSQNETIERFKQSNDLFGTQKQDLIQFLSYENAKPFLSDDYISKIESGEEKYQMLTESKSKILGYLDYAYDKAFDERGLSAQRSMLHFKTWIWLDDQEFYDEVIDLIDGFEDYGIPALDAISKHYKNIKTKII